MRTVHVLAADCDGGPGGAGPGPYWRMTALSALSVRTAAPAARMTLVTDAATLAALAAGGLPDAALAATFDDVVTLPTAPGDARVRSRALKIAVRSAVAGDVLYLDVDTVVCGDLAPLAATTADIAAVSDQHRTTPELADVEERVYAACGWRPPSRLNLNSGVVYWRDTPAAHALAALWREKWHASRAITGRHNDQQALNSAAEDLPDVAVAELPAAYNAQLTLRPETAFGARIWHVFSSDRGRVPTLRTVFDPYWDGALPPDDARPLFARRHPFRIDGPLDAAVLALLVRRADRTLPFNDWRRLWLAGCRGEATRTAARELRAAAGRRVRAGVARPLTGHGPGHGR